MHNSHNSVPSKDSYRSASLAQAKLLGSSDITEVPTFHNPVITLPEVTDEMRATLSLLSASICQRMLLAERGQELMSKAENYNIPYNKDSIDWLRLIDEVEQYEALLEEASELNLSWNESEYDPVALEQEIENATHREYKLQKNLYCDFFTSNTLGV